MSGFPTLAELLNTLAVLGEQPAALGALITAVLLVIVRDWRWSLLTLAIQYILVGWLLTQVIEAQIAVLKILAGLIICLVLYITARQARWGRGPQNAPAGNGRRVLPTSQVFRLLLGLLVGIVILYTTSNGRVALPELPAHINLAAVSLLALGLLALGLTEEPLTAGMGLLTFMAGFELFYHSLEQAITVIGFLLGIDCLIAIIIAYLTVAHHLRPEEARQRLET